MYPVFFPITLEKCTKKDRNGIGPVHLAKGVVTEARGKKMEVGQVGLA